MYTLNYRKDVSLIFLFDYNQSPVTSPSKHSLSVHSFIFAFIQSSIHPFIHSAIHSLFNCPLSSSHYPVIHSSIRSSIYNSFIHLSIYNHSFIYNSFIHSSIYSFVHSSLHLSIIQFSLYHSAIYLSIPPYFHQSVHLSINASINLCKQSF